MMFKYRAKSLEKVNRGKFVYGNKIHLKSIRHSEGFALGIQELKSDGRPTGNMYKVDPSTLGVCWGMKDKNGKDVYTGMFFKSEQGQCIKGQLSCSGMYWVPQLFKICFRKSAFVGINQDEEIQYAGHTFRGGSVVAIPEELEIIEEE